MRTITRLILIAFLHSAAFAAPIHQLEVAFIGPIQAIPSSVPNQDSFAVEQATLLEPNERSLKNLQFITKHSHVDLLGFGNWKISLSNREEKKFLIQTSSLTEENLDCQMLMKIKNGRYIDLIIDSVCYQADSAPMFIHHARRAKLNQMQFIDTHFFTLLLHMS